MSQSSSSTISQTTKPTIKLSKEINPKFYKVWRSAKPYNVLKGGRNSFKSSVIALLLVFMMVKAITQGQCVEIIIVRKVGNTIFDSVYKKIIWALDKFGMTNQFKRTKSPYKIVHRRTVQRSTSTARTISRN